MNKIYKVIWNH
ncbi:hypothetical protein ABGM33_004662, partial [Escherichia coli]|nr:hypothetical protein [Escherichia coli]EKQ3813512.1 hypothetical protein [Escherichia coli]EKQ3862968.1 hypothetical protein [Escherichia coli]EKS6011264.1 hypothetical protein [Escherichia coli]ELK8139082.1 hypothetical protein [Escherichia coli]